MISSVNVTKSAVSLIENFIFCAVKDSTTESLVFSVIIVTSEQVFAHWHCTKKLRNIIKDICLSLFFS